MNSRTLTCHGVSCVPLNPDNSDTDACAQTHSAIQHCCLLEQMTEGLRKFHPRTAKELDQPRLIYHNFVLANSQPIKKLPKFRTITSLTRNISSSQVLAALLRHRGTLLQHRNMFLSCVRVRSNSCAHLYALA